MAAPATAAAAPAKKDPVHAEEAFLAGARLLDRGDLNGAQGLFARAVALDPDKRDYTLALDLVRQHRIGDLIEQSAKARLLHQSRQADALLAEARAIDPNDERVRQHFASDGGQIRPQFTVIPSPSPGAASALGVAAAAEDREHATLAFAPPVQLAPNPAVPAFDQVGDVRTVVTTVAGAYGIKASFDPSVTAEQVHFQLEANPYRLAMPVLLSLAHLFAVAVDPHTILVAKDSEENRQRLERQVEETIYVPGITPLQLNELLQIIKNVFDVRQVVTAPTSGSILVRAPEDTIKAVNYTIADLVDGGAQVQLEVKLYSVDKMVTRAIGLSTPTSINAFSVPGEATSIVNANQSAVQALISSGAYVPTGNTARDVIAEALLLVLSGVVTDAKVTNLIATLGGGISLFGIDAGSGATFNLGLNSSDTRALDDLNVRVGDGEETTLRVGERYPITTSTYSSGLSSSLTSALGNTTINGVSAASLLSQYVGTGSVATIPIIQYEDLGITFKTTPHVLKSGLISLNLNLKIESLEGGTLDSIPLLNSEVFTSTLTLKDGSSAILLSDLTSSGSSAVSGLPGLGELPGFNESVGGTRTVERDHSELILLVTPHLVRRRSDVLATRPYVFHSSVPAEF